MRIYLIIALFLTSYTYANECLYRGLEELMGGSSVPARLTFSTCDWPTLSKKIDSFYEQVAKRADLHEQLESTTKASEINKIKNDIKLSYLNLKRINKEFIQESSKVLKSQGVPNTIYEKDKFSVLKLDLESADTSNFAFNYFKRIKEKYGIENITISLKENVELGSRGFYTGDRVDIGMYGVEDLIDGKIGQTAKHEIRHAIFNKKRKNSTPSSYYISFRKSTDGQLLNDVDIYDEYMSAEEIYNWSTDLHHYANKLDKLSPKDLLSQPVLLERMIRKNLNLSVISNTSKNVTNGVLENVNKMLSNDSFEDMKVFQECLTVTDDIGRQVDVEFLLKDRKKILVDIGLVELKIKLEFLKKRFSPFNFRKSSELLREEIQKSARGLQLQNELNTLKRTVLLEAKGKIEDLNMISSAQHLETKALDELLLKFKDPIEGGRPEQLDEIRQKLIKISKNVKEGYKNSILNTLKNNKKND